MKQVNKNFTTNILRLLVNVTIGILYTPYLVKSVGIIAYGIVPLALIINQYINIISLSLINALTRFYSIEYRGNDFTKASKYFSTSIIAGIVFTLVLYPILHLSINHIDSYFDIPRNLLIETKWLFRFTVGSFFISILSNCVNTTLFADNLLDYVNYLKVIRQASKFIANIALFAVLGTNILYIGLASLASELLVLLFSIIFYKKTKPQGISFSLKLYKKSYLLTILGMMTWVLTQRFSDTFLYKIDSVLMNLYFGIKMTGIIGAISEFGSYVVSVTTILSSLFAPLLLISYSKKNFSDYKRMTIDGSYIVGLFTSLLCGLLCGSASTLLRLWLGHGFENYGAWLIIKIVIIPYTTAGALFANSYLYANYNKKPALASLFLAFINIAINISLLHIFYSVYMFLLICLMFIIAQGLLMNIYFYNHLYPGDLKCIIMHTIKYTIYMICIGTITYLSMTVLNIHNITQLIILYITVFCIGVIVLDTIFLSEKQRSILFEITPIYQTIRSFIIKPFRK